MIETPTLDLLKFCAFPDVAAALKKRTAGILARWEQVVRDKLPAADSLTHSQLHDHLPAVLIQIAITLEETNDTAIKELKALSAGHGELRFDQTFNLNGLLVEYGLLRPFILSEVIAELGRPMEPAELVALNMAVDTTIRRSTVSFAEHQAEQLKAVTTAQSKYLSFLSHDLRGGLNGVLLMMEVLKRDLTTEARFAESVEDIEAMRRSILDTVGTMDRFLHAERFRQGRVQVKKGDVDVRALLHDLQQQFAYQAKDKKLVVRTESVDGTVINTDKELLQLILSNLVSNAIKYTPSGEIRVIAMLTDLGATISIGDDGPGISEDKMEHLFDAFTRGDTHGQAGVGLGLTIAKQAADLLGAELTVESAAGKGTTFILNLK